MKIIIVRHTALPPYPNIWSCIDIVFHPTLWLTSIARRPRFSRAAFSTEPMLWHSRDASIWVDLAILMQHIYGVSAYMQNMACLQSYLQHMVHVSYLQHSRARHSSLLLHSLPSIQSWNGSRMKSALIGFWEWEGKWKDNIWWIYWYILSSTSSTAP